MKRDVYKRQVDALSTTIISYEYESFKFNIDSMQLDVNKQVL